MYQEILAAIGAIILAYSVYLCKRLVRLIEWPYLRKPWRILSFFLFLSLIGYIAYIYVLLSAAARNPNDLLLSAVLFADSAFIMLSVRSSFRLADNLKASEAHVTFNRHSLETEQRAVERMRSELEEKNEELEKVIAELYALRNILEKGKSRQSGSEMRRMKKILDDLKSGLGRG